jgi:nitroreductase
VSAAPALVLCLSDPGAYLDRYAQADKGWVDRSPDRWPIPYWDTDTAMAAMIILLGADRMPGWAPCSSASRRQRHDAVREAHGIPEDRRLVGVIALGAPAARAAHTGGSPRTRPRRPLEDVLHEGRFGGWSGASA